MASENRIIGILSVECILMLVSKVGGEMYASAKYMDLLNEQGRNDWRPDKKKIVDARANFISPSYITDSDGKYVEVFRFIKNVYNKKQHTYGAHICTITHF